MAFRRPMRISRGPTRSTVWFFFDPLEVTLGAASTASLMFTLNAAALALRPFTVVRTRGILGMRTDNQAAQELQSLSLGFAVVSEQATAVGVTAVPTPETDRGSELFFVYESLAGFHELFTAVGFNPHGQIVTKYDSKAMRKVNEGEDIAVVAETSSISLGAIVHVSGRMLVKLH